MTDIKELSSKELYNMVKPDLRETLPLINIHYKDIKNKCSVWEKCGLQRVREIKNNDDYKVFKIVYNRKELLERALTSLDSYVKL